MWFKPLAVFASYMLRNAKIWISNQGRITEKIPIKKGYRKQFLLRKDTEKSPIKKGYRKRFVAYESVDDAIGAYLRLYLKMR